MTAAHEAFVKLCEEAGTEMPVNHHGDDLLLRDLDCAVINHLHEANEGSGGQSFDTVRGVFIEGARIYKGAGFFEKTHIQICVRNHGCIKGVFAVPEGQLQG